MFQFSPLSFSVSMFNLAAQLPADGAIVGTEGADTLTGTAADDEIWGYGGNDRIIGGFGADYLYGGAGNDWFGFSAISSASSSRIGLIDGGDGIDTLNLSTVSPIVVGTIQLDNGDYSLGVYVGGQKFAITNVERIVLNDLDNGFYWTNFTDQPVSVFGGAGNDYLNGSPNLSLHGEVGDDIFFVSGTFGGAARAGAVYGGAGIDTLRTNILFTVDLAAGTATSGTASYTISSIEIVEVVPAPAHPSIVYGSDAAETFRINPTFADRTGTVTFHSRGGDDVLEGGLGDDLLDGGDGADRMDGGQGNDRYWVDRASDVIIETADGGIDTVHATASYALGANIERIILEGNANIAAIGNDLSNELIGNAGNNALKGGLGADRMEGGFGNDSYYVDDAADMVIEIADGGMDSIYADVSYSLVGTHAERLILQGDSDLNATGNSLGNLLVGNSGNNRLDGQAGLDRMEGRGGDDLYVVDRTGDVAVEQAGEGVDTIEASVTYSLAGSYVEHLVLTGRSAIQGYGNSLANSITGNEGANLIDGGARADILTGGDGADMFRFSTALGNGNTDTITDFMSASDRIRLSPTIFANVGPNGRLAEAAFAIGSVADQADDRILYDSVSGALFYDADGNGGGAAIQFASLAPGLALSHADFVIG